MMVFMIYSTSSTPHYSTVSSSSCRVYPSGYAYRDDSVNRAESPSANCRRYQGGFQASGVNTDQYIHCDGNSLKLTDSDLGQEQYHSSSYYWWAAGSDGQLLFIFPTRVSLTTITLHYYSDSDRGLSELRFYAVPDDFDVWDAPSTRNPYVDVATIQSGEEPAGQRNISINTMFNMTKLLMYKFSNTYYKFALSEVEFFHCISKLPYIYIMYDHSMS